MQKSSFFGYKEQRNLLLINQVNLLKRNIIYLKDNSAFKISTLKINLIKSYIGQKYY